MKLYPLLFCHFYAALSAFDHSIQQDPFMFSWSIAGDNITAELSLTGAGAGTLWFAVAFSESGSMAGADMIVGRSDGTSLTLEDRYGTAFTTPDLDDLQDVELIDSVVGAGTTSFKFTRKLLSCDRDEDVDIMDKNTVLLFAMGENDFTFHTAISTAKTNLMSHDDSPFDFGTASNITLSLPQAEVPLHDNYTCMASPVTDHITADTNYQIIFMEGIRDNTWAHSGGLFGCNIADDTNFTSPYECTNNMAGCVSLGGWTLGSGPRYYPDEAGLPVSSAMFSHFVIQIHYKNEAATPQYDSSGITFAVDTTLRANEMGRFVVGNHPFLLTGDPLNSAECPMECTNTFGDEEYQVVWSFMFMHKYGLNAKLRQIRDGVELPPLGQRRFWDEDYSQAETVELGRTIKQGDRLILECEYDLAAAGGAILGGQAPGQEVCFAFVWTYPPIDKTYCLDYHGYSSFEGAGFYANQSLCHHTVPGNEDILTLAQAGEFQTPGGVFVTYGEASEFEPFDDCKCCETPNPTQAPTTPTPAPSETGNAGKNAFYAWLWVALIGLCLVVS